MAIEILVPRLGWTMETGTFLGWLKRDGERVEAGEPLFELEGEKGAQAVEAAAAGTLRTLPGGPRPGDAVPVGAVLGRLVAEGEAEGEAAIAPPAAAPSTAPEASVQPPKPVAQEPLQARPAPGSPRGEPSPQASRRAAASPRARRAASELGVDWTRLRGSGRGGRIRERDVRAAAGRQQPGAARAGPAAPGLTGRLLPLTLRRRAIARRVAAGVHEAVPVTLTMRADATALVELRERLRAAAPPGGAVPTCTDVSFTDIIVKLCATALEEHPMLQAQWREEGLFAPDGIHVAIAVDAEEGLVAPVLRDVPSRSLREIAAASRDLIERARRGALKAAELEGGTFTVSNLGMHGVETFTPVLNAPQGSILGVGAIQLEPAVRAGAVVPRHRICLSLTFDHRVVDGAPAARFLVAVRRRIESPPAWLEG